MAASSSSSQVPCGKYDVFISFRGRDVRFGFLSHLERELDRKGIDVYVDDRLEGGEAIPSALMNAIEGSKIALVIFSKYYASSRWCLEELVKIIECMEDGQRIVIPVFYLVDPSDVRHQKGTYAEAFTLHEEKFKDSVGNLQNWRSVLEKSANLSGHHSSAFRKESQLIDAIVEDVSKKLEAANSPIMPQSHLIGFHQNFTSVESLMEIELQEEVRILGIWGMGGIGKTTLAQAIFDKFLSEFESHCFLENVREKATKVDDLKSLHQKLISKLLNIKDHINMKDAKRRLQGKKVLIVLDDVDNPKQVKDLVGRNQLGLGSRVIVTSRDMHVLRSGGINHQFIHEVNELSSKESLELFSIHAFNQSHPKMGYQELSKMIVAIAKGIPLALEVLGSHFHSRGNAYWESELRKLDMYPRKQIQDILEISYHGLDPMDKEIFLDIAFFFIGKKRDKITCGLEACGFEAVSGIQNLIDKALIKSNQDGDIVMHDLIREMAEQVVRAKNTRHPEMRSRLKDVDEIRAVLKSNMGTNGIEGIILDMTQIKHVQVEADVFVKMKNLRFLEIFDSCYWWSHGETYVSLLSDLDSFSNKLRYLHWDHYPSETLPSGSYLENLVELHMRGSKVTRLWDGKQDLGNLKKINLSYSEQLMELPDFSMAHKLEIVYLTSCKSLRSVHPSILSLPSVIRMNVSGCSKLESIEIHLESLSYFCARDCSFKKFCLSANKLRQLYLWLPEAQILHFPIGHCTEVIELCSSPGMLGSVSIDELCCLTNLEVFELINLKQVIDIKQLHPLFDAWRNLRELRLNGWSYLSEIPDNIEALTKLKCLSLDESAVETLPAYVSHLSSLRYIYLRRCKRLKSILGLPPSLQGLYASECTLLETVSSDSLVRSECLFDFSNCEKLDERSLRYIHKLILCSMSSARVCCDDDDCTGEITCYPGSRVPKWMEYKPMTESFNVIKFTCNLERSQDLLICFVAPHLDDRYLTEVRCYISRDDNKKFHNYDKNKLHYACDIDFFPLNKDHVFLWPIRGFLSGLDNDAKISCEFILVYYDEIEGPNYSNVPAKACGAQRSYYSEPGRKRKRVEDQLPPTKQLKNSGVY